MENYTVRQVANLAGVSKAAIRFRMRKIQGFRNLYCHKVGSRKTLVINRNGTKKLLGNKNRALHNNLSGNELIKYLISQNEQLNKHVNDLTTALNHEQELNLASQAQVKQLRGQVQKSGHQHHNWIWKLFH